ncbi:hypothetical protein JXQ31_02865 [candidate division KSB1 bacterium]|nr:hypothetical protein [candidate division KSB1 bacterium]
MNHTPVSKYKPYSGRSSGPVYIIIILLFALMFAGIRYGYNSIQKAQQRSKLLLTATLIEGRHKLIGPFFSLYTWFGIFNKVENFYYQRYQEYTGPAGLTDELITAIDPGDVLRKIRTTFWDNGLFLDTFIPYDSLKSTMYNKYGRNFRYFLTGLDSAVFKYEFILGKDKSEYTIKVMELKDINFDHDTRDYFIYKSNSKEPEIRFFDRGKKTDPDLFIQEYSNWIYKDSDPDKNE